MRSHGSHRYLFVVGVLFAATGCAVKPVVLTTDEVKGSARVDVERLSKPEDAVTAAISLDEAIARAVRSNRDRKLKVLEAALAQRQSALARHDLLPSLTASAGYTGRDNYAASASVRFADGVPEPLPADPAYSVSQDKQRSTYDVAFTWNVLDFGLSYVRAQQQADRFLIAKERERKVVHNISQEVRAAYWRAVSAERLLQKIGPLIERAESALKDSRKVETQQLRPPLEALQYQRELLEILRSLQSLRQELVNAGTELAVLMGLRPGTPFALVDVNAPSFVVPDIRLDVEKMEEVAIQQRPELLEARYQKRISVAEAKTALLRLLPGISLSTGVYHDSSDYLLNRDWVSAGAQVSWNLLNVFRLDAEKQVSGVRDAWVEEQRLASSMAVLSQVHIARFRYEQSLKTFELAGLYNDVAARIHDQTRTGAKMQRISELVLIRESLNSLLAELRRDVAYADLQNSFGRMFMTMGLDLVPENHREGSLSDLTQDITQRFSNWQRGELGTSALGLPSAVMLNAQSGADATPGSKAGVSAGLSAPVVQPTAAELTPAPVQPEAVLAATQVPEQGETLRLRMDWAVRTEVLATRGGKNEPVRPEPFYEAVAMRSIK